MMNKKIVVASNNAHKISEIKAILVDIGYDVVSLKDEGIDVDPEENGSTFSENAIIKVKGAREHTNDIVIADDSGLIVDCLNGKPGVKSKRYAGPDATDEDNNKLLVKNIKKLDVEKPEARFISCIAIAFEDGSIETVEGKCEGVIVTEHRGDNGFGYDPHFFIPSLNKTMAELSKEQKNDISHRADALKKLRKLLIQRG